MTNRIELLGGKVVKESLPITRGAPAPGASRLKRLMLAQGELAHVHDGPAGIQYIASVELREGGLRGNHYHKHKEEFLYIIEGEILLVVEDVENRARESVSLGAGDLGVIAAGVAHVFRPLKPGRAIEFSPTRFDAADIYAYSLTEGSAPHHE
jgi:mannose-6-phosphate isomerase-like protein (cupin superfamily)